VGSDWYGQEEEEEEERMRDGLRRYRRRAAAAAATTAVRQNKTMMERWRKRVWNKSKTVMEEREEGEEERVFVCCGRE